MKKISPQHRMLVAITALILILALLLAANHKLPVAVWTQNILPRAMVNLTAVPVGTINKPISITRTGSIENSTTVPIHAGFSGQLSEIYVTEGQAVKAGQPLLKLQISSNQATGISQAKVNYDNALKEFNRLQKLYEIGAIPRRQFELATTQLQEAKERLASSQNTIQSSSTTVNGSATINAPIGGIVTGLSTAPGKSVLAEQQLLALGSGQEVEVIVQLDQENLYLVPLGSAATIETKQQTIVGQVSRIYPKIEANQITAFLAHITLSNNPSGLLKSGMSVPVRIDTGKTAIMPAVPKLSIFQDNRGRNFIYLATRGKAVLQKISIGETIGDFTEITSSLPQQSMVITSNINDIKDGDTVTVMP